MGWRHCTVAAQALCERHEAHAIGVAIHFIQGGCPGATRACGLAEQA
jgi:hypothetical protein